MKPPRPTRVLWKAFLTDLVASPGQGHPAARRLVWGILREAERSVQPPPCPHRFTWPFPCIQRQKLRNALPPRPRPVSPTAELLPEETRRATRLHRALHRGGVVMLDDVVIAHAGDAGGVISLLEATFTPLLPGTRGA